MASDKTAQVNPITVGVTEGNSASIAKGVSPGDVVVVDGAERLRSGMAVDARFDQGNRGPGGGSQNVSADNQAGGGADADGGGGGRRRRGGDGQGGGPDGNGGRGGGNGGNGGGNGRKGGGERSGQQQGKNKTADSQYPKNRS